MGITTHVLDLSRGCPGEDIRVTLERNDGDAWSRVGAGATDADGRCRTLVPEGFEIEPGTFRISFDVEEYQARHGVSSFYPKVSIVFTVRNGSEHHHVPLLLSPWGYSTYRGS